MNIVILGTPASGKGTQAEILCQKFGLYHLSTGDIARELIKKDARLREIYTKGKLIPQEEMTMHVLKFLGENKPDLKNILFEGFPRFVSQYEALENFLKTNGDDIDAVIFLDVSKEEAVKRISSRRVCSKCAENYNLVTKPPKKDDTCDLCQGSLFQRDDDKPEAIESRFQAYFENTQLLIDFLNKKGMLTKVNAERPIEDIARDLEEIVKKLKT